MNMLFVIAAIVAVLGGVGVVLARPPVHSLLALILNLVALAVLFLTLSAEFMALIQIIVYAGAIMVLFLFVIGLLTVKAEEIDVGPARLPGQRVGGMVAAGLLALLLIVVGAFSAGDGWAGLAEGFGSVRAMGEVLFLVHVFPLQLAALILLVAAVGVAMLLGRQHLRGTR